METNFTRDLLNWYSANEHSMPWRGETDVYRVWLSEVMLQQTQFKAVIPYYQRWLRRFPTPKHVADASEEEVLKHWEGLGYYARVRNFRVACQDLHENHGGQIPPGSDEFRNLKGVGDYIHAAVRSIAFHEPIPAIDGNVMRVVSRLKKIEHPPHKSVDIIRPFLDRQISRPRPGDFNQALMDLGRNICKPANPSCDLCPVSNECGSFVDNCVDKHPVKQVKKSIPHYNVAVGVVWKEDLILITKRHSSAMLGGLWEFPGGKLQNNETHQNCIQREINEELGVNVTIFNKIKTIKHAYSHFKITLTAYHCQYESGELRTLGCADFRWISPEDISSLPFPKANHKLFNKIPRENPCSFFIH